MSRAPLLSALALCALIGVSIVGVPRLQVDGLRAFALPEGHPLIELNEALDARTGGDDVLVAAVIAEPGVTIFAPGPLGAVEDVREAMLQVPTLSGVRDLRQAPVLAERDGALTAVTPFDPLPADSAGIAAAADVVLADPFVRDQLVARSGRVAVVVGWIERGGEDVLLGRMATIALRDPDLGETDVGREIRDEINAARMAIALGEAEGAPQAEVARRLRELADRGGPAGDVVKAMVEASQVAAADPGAVALADLKEALGQVDGGGARIELAGPQVTTEALADATGGGVKAALIGLILAAGLAVGWRRRSATPAIAAACAPGFAMAVGLGFCGLLDAPMHLPTALAGLSGALWAGAIVAASAVGPVPLVRLSLVAVVAGAAWGYGLGDAGAALAPVACLLSGTAAAWILVPTITPYSEEEVPVSHPSRWTPYVAAAVGVAGVFVLVGRPVGLDVGGLLRDNAPAGETGRLLAEELGTAPAAWLALRVDEPPRAMARPGSLRALRTGQEALSSESAVAGTVSWADFVSRLHSQVSGAAPGELPPDPSLVDQYLLAFGKPKQTRVLVAEDLSLGVVMIRLTPGGAAQLGRMAEENWPAGDQPLALAGDAVAMALSARLSAREMLGAALVALFLLVALLAPGRASSKALAADGLVVLAGGLVAMGASASLLGTLAPSSCAAGVVALALGWLARRCGPGGAPAAGLAAAGLIPLALSPALQLHAFGAGIAIAALLLALCRVGEGPSSV